MTAKINILNLIDFEKVNKLLEGFNQSTGFVTAILDLQGNVLSKSGWRQICTRFHRINPKTSKNCTVSDTVLANELGNGEKYHFYKCLNGLVDVAVPLIIKGEHIANLFSGQFFFEEPNRNYFKKQARKFGFNEEEYLRALENVPVVSKEKVKIAMDFLLNMTQLISEITLQKLEQEQSNKALIESEERLRTVISSSADWVWEVDKDGKYIYSSQKSIDFFGISEEEIIGKTPFDLMPEDKAKRVAPIFTEITAKKQPIKDLENWSIGKNGELICLLTNALPILNNEGELVGYRGIDKNITQRKLFEKELIKAKEKAEESEKKYRAFVEQSSEGIYRMELDKPMDLSMNIEEQIDFIYKHTYIAECNHRLAQMYGNKSPEDLLGIKQQELHGGKNNQKNRQALKNFITSNYRLTNVETEERIKDGKSIQLLNSAVGYIENGKLLRYWGLKIDITEQKRILQELTQAKEKAEEGERALKHSYDLMKYIIEHNRSAIAVHDKDYKYIFVSQRYLQDYQVKEKEIIGKHHYDVFQDLPQKWHDVHKKALMGEVSSAENDPYYKDDGTVGWARWECRPWYDRDNSIGGFIIYSEVITDRINMELKLREAKEKAEESDRLKSAFLANMSHEIRTPMNGILGFTDLLLNPDLNSKERENFIKIVHKSGQRMLNTVNDIVEVSKIEAGIISVRNQKIDINTEVEEMVHFFKPEAKKKGLNLMIDLLLPDNKKHIETDKDKLSSIISNLIKNAIKYTESGTIKVGCKLNDSLIELYVKDTGIGIPAHRQEAIFNRFEQADIADEMAFEGSGLGLAIAKSYVEMLGGKIWVESKEGIGSTFCFTLPAKKNITDNSSAEKKNSSKYEKPKLLNRKLKILIADDDEISRKYLHLLINDFGKEIMEAETGSRALELCQKYYDIDLIFMDIKMPLMDGYQATRKIREFNKDVVIIAQTAYALSGDMEKALEAGCNDYISKPFVKTKLENLLQKYFGKHLQNVQLLE